MADGIAFIAGAYIPAEDAKISIFDLGFIRSDVVYDVVSTWKGLFFRLDDHIDRFHRTCQGVRLTCPHTKDDIKRILAECVHRAGIEDAYVEMLVTRGRFATPSGRDIRQCTPNFIAYAIPYVWVATPDQQERGLSVVIAERRRIPDESFDQRHKNFQWGDLTGGLFEALDKGADTAILCTPSGHLAEGPGFNVFFVKGDRLFTPRRNALEGITRRTVFDLARELGIGAEAGDHPPEALRGADEAFICSTAGGIMPVTRIDGAALGDGTPGPISSRLRQLYWSKREAGWLGTRVEDLIGKREVA
jgi:branched-chain amino acid aminotransferase